MIKRIKPKKQKPVNWVQVENEEFQSFFNPQKDNLETYEVMHYSKGHADYPIGFTFMIWGTVHSYKWKQLFKQEEKLGSVRFWIEEKHLKKLKS